MASRSRSPAPCQQRKTSLGLSAGGSAADDVVSAQALREAYSAPAQSLFRVAAVLRFRRSDGSEGVIEAVNVEPHDANIRGAICAERAAMCKFQRDEEKEGSKIFRVVCVTDSPKPIFPGPLCREYLTSMCAPETEVVVAGSADPFNFFTRPLSDLLPLPSVYSRRNVNEMKVLAKELEGKVGPPAGSHLAAAYTAALEKARKQKAQQLVFPLVFAAAVHFADGRTYAVSELKAMEYGGTVDAVSLLLPEMLRVKDEEGPTPVCVMQVDQYGVAHAPFASARTLLVEHGFEKVTFVAHDVSGKWSSPMSADESLPFAFTEWVGNDM
mmetsp:Transcript_78429/g.199415  ORF Transcript_78429/g.199415 Transcript_78429/m.199415 type:complete len:326 (+) Transcript_78429:80-1057(+)